MKRGDAALKSGGKRGGGGGGGGDDGAEELPPYDMFEVARVARGVE